MRTPPFEYTVTPARLGAGIVLATSLLLAACGGNKDNASALKADSALGRDLALAASDTGAKPKLQDEPAPAPAATVPAKPEEKPEVKPVTPAPKPEPKATKPASKPTPKPTATTPAVTPAPAPAPPPAPEKPTTGTIAAGTPLRFEANSKVCTGTAHVGDKFTAALTAAVPGSNGVEIPAGATGTFEVKEAKTAQNNGDTTYMKVRLVSITYGGDSYPLDASIVSAATSKVRSATKGDDAKKVGGGAVIGAIAGRIIGGSGKGAVIGAAAGAAAGGVAAVTTADFNTCINSGAVIVAKLEAGAVVRIAN